MSYLKIYFTFVLCLNVMQKVQAEERKEENTADGRRRQTTIDLETVRVENKSADDEVWKYFGYVMLPLCAEGVLATLSEALIY